MMPLQRLVTRAALGSLLLGLAGPAYAGGPLNLFDPATETPFAYPPGTVSVRTDLGSLGPLTQAETDSLVRFAFAQWTGVPTSYFAGEVTGEIELGGIPTDITLANVDSLIGPYNGGGIHVIYDHDGSILQGFFGAPPGVAGVATPEYSGTGVRDLLESWAVFNGNLVDPADLAPIPGSAFAGVITHELGHAINLAHAQTNGAIVFFGDALGPSGCAGLGGLPTVNDVETMYPFIDPSPLGTGIAQSTVDLREDIVSISDLYPTAGWPGTHGTLTGVIRMPDATEVTGVNIIARNVADPVGDAVSTLSGDLTQGVLGPDGAYTLNGLTPGASYVVYVDRIDNGGFSTPVASVDYFEEYWNGAGESGDLSTDSACVSVPVVPVAGVPVVADFVLNVDPNALSLGDDAAMRIPLPFVFPFCGGLYDSVWVSSNGCLTFGAGDAAFLISTADLMAGPPRIAALWSDLTPDLGGSITAGAVGSDFVVAYTGVPEFLFGGANTFSITLRPDGTHRVDYGSLTSQGALFGALAGRSPGGGAVDPGSTDLGAAVQPLGMVQETVYEHFLFGPDLGNSQLEFAACGDVTAARPGPAGFRNLASSPNPFRARTGVTFTLAQRERATVSVFDVRGRRIEVLVDTWLDAGDHAVQWSGSSVDGGGAAPGLYLLVLETPSQRETHKVMRLP